MIDQFGNYVPEWVQFDEDEQNQTPDLGPFAQALKSRFASNKKPAPGHPDMGHGGTNLITMPEHTSVPAGVGGHEAKGFGGAGMKSL